MNRFELEFLFKLDFCSNATMKAFLLAFNYAGTRFQIDKSLQVGCRFDEQKVQAQLKNEKQRSNCSVLLYCEAVEGTVYVKHILSNSQERQKLYFIQINNAVSCRKVSMYGD